MDRAWIGQTDPVIAIARDSRQRLYRWRVVDRLSGSAWRHHAARRRDGAQGIPAVNVRSDPFLTGSDARGKSDLRWAVQGGGDRRTRRKTLAASFC
jgi:hypothetical protein